MAYSASNIKISVIFVDETNKTMAFKSEPRKPLNHGDRQGPYAPFSAASTINHLSFEHSHIVTKMETCLARIHECD